MNLAVLPLAITMNAGPQIMSAILFVTARKPLKLSAYYIAGAVIAVTAGVTITFTLASVLGNSVSLGDPSDSGSLGKIIQYVLVGLLVYPVHQELSDPQDERAPQVAWRLWRTPGPGRRSLPGLLLLSIFPTDLVILITVGMNLVQQRLLPTRRCAFRRGNHLDSGASCALLPAVPSSR